MANTTIKQYIENVVRTVLPSWLNKVGTAIFSNVGSSTPLANGTATPGTSTNLAREDHVHPGSTGDASTVYAELVSHEGNTSNPHSVTASQVGLGNVNNTSDLNKPISTATQTALNENRKTAIAMSIALGG